MSASWSRLSLAHRILIFGFMAFLVLLSFGAAGCSSSDDDDDGGTTPTPDTTPPPEVTSFLALPADGHVTLSWSLPISNDLAGVQIRRATEAAPTATTGDVVYEGLTSPYVDSAVTNDQVYYYGAFTYDDARNFSAGVTRTCTPRTGAGVTFADANLEQALREELGVPSGDITDVQMESLLELDLAYEGIADLQGLQYATNLYDLDLSDNVLDNDGNLQLLAQLTALRYLDLGGNEFTVLPDLTALTLLEQLTLIDLPISSLAPLSGMASLTHLQFGYCSVSDLAPLQNLTSLRRLSFQNCDVTSLGPLSGLANLESLQILHCAISSLDVAAQLPQLLHLGVEYAGVTDLAPLAGLTQLQTLTLAGNGLSDLTPLAGLSGLTVLQVGGNQVRDVSPLAGLTGLESLDIGSNPILDISMLDGLTGLTYFSAGQCWISDISVLSGWSELTDVDLFGCAVGTESVESVIPALETANVEVNFDYESAFLQLLGVWNIGSITANGDGIDPGDFFGWDPETVSNHLIVFPWGEYRSEDLDADGLPLYYERGHLVLDGDNVSVQAFEMDGEAVWPIEEVFAGTWARDGTDLVFTTVDGADTVVMTWVR